jgi:hypothetical protein
VAKELNAGVIVDSMFAVAENIRKLGVEKVAEAAGVQARVVRKFLNDMMASKNSDIKKIKDGVNKLLNPNEEN